MLDQKTRKKQEAAAQAHAGLRRPLPRQGHQGAAGAIAPEGAGAHGADRRADRGRAGQDLDPLAREDCCRRRSSPWRASPSATSRAIRCCTNLNLRIDDDDRIALLGPNGNGKSTFAKLLAGRLEPQAGRIVTRATSSRSPISPSISSTNCTTNESPYDHVRALMPDAPEAQRARTRGRDRLFRRCRRHQGQQRCRAAKRRGCCWGSRAFAGRIC